jgi:hypothetical protein
MTRYAHLAPEHLRSEMVKTERRAHTVDVSAQASTQEVAAEIVSGVPTS